MRCRIPTRWFVALLAAGAGACADSTAPAAGVTEAIATRDVARDAAEATTQDLMQIAGNELLIGMPLAVSAQRSSSAFGNCTWVVAVSMYGCPAITTPDGLTLRRYFQIYGAGSPQRSYDPVATDSILMQGTLTGTLTEAGRTAWINRSLMLLVTGLGGTETQRTWRGDGSRDDSVHVQGDGVVRTTRMHSDDVVDNVVYKLPRASFPFPQSGTITHDVIVKSTVPNGTEATNLSTARHVVVTFNGTQTASVLVGTTACTLDLVTRKLSCN